MDKYPISRGHTLIIPKTHYDNLLLMPHNEVGRLYSLVPIIAGAIVTAVKADGFNVGQNNGKAANQIVPHVHVHIIPRFNDDSPKGRWPMRRVASHEELFKTADGIKRFLNPPWSIRNKFRYLLAKPSRLILICRPICARLYTLLHKK